MTRLTYRCAAFGVAVASILSMTGGAAAEDSADVGPGRVLTVTTDMTLGEARAALPDVVWRYEPIYMVDFSADCAERDGEALFCALVYEDPDFAASAEIEALVVVSPALRAAAGVRVGMPLAEAEQMWGDATLSFHYANEGREYVDFAAAPESISARAALPGAEPGFHVGLYPAETANDEYQQTTDYKAGATIDSLWIY